MSIPPLTRIITIQNERGLHARPSAKFAACAGEYEAEITVTKDGETVPATSIMGLLMFGASTGTELELSATGKDAAAALDALEALVSSRFGEDIPG